MTDDLIYTASGFELLFLASTLTGVWFSRQNLREAWGDFRALGGLANGRRSIAVTTIVTETLLLSVHALYIIAALFAITQPSAGVTSTVGVLIASILVYASWALTSITILSRRLRRYLVHHGLQPRDSRGRFTS